MSGGIIKVSRNTELAPINPLSTQSVAFSHYNNISAQLPIDPKTGHIVAGDIKQQAKQCLENIKAIVESIYHVMDDVVKIHVFVKNIDDLALIDEVYATFFPNLLPVRTVVAVNALPLHALVQMDALISNGEAQPQEPCPLIAVEKYRQGPSECIVYSDGCLLSPQQYFCTVVVKPSNRRVSCWWYQRTNKSVFTKHGGSHVNRRTV